MSRNYHLGQETTLPAPPKAHLTALTQLLLLSSCLEVIIILTLCSLLIFLVYTFSLWVLLYKSGLSIFDPLWNNLCKINFFSALND